MDGTLMKCYTLILVFMGFVNVLLMLEVIGQKGGLEGFRLIHRWIGRVFVLSFLVLFLFMVSRIRSLATFPTHILLHSVIALAIVPLAVGKYLVIKRYRHFTGSASLIGVIIATGTFVLVTMVVGPSLFAKLFGE